MSWFTKIDHDNRLKLGLTWEEYGIADYIWKRQLIAEDVEGWTDVTYKDLIRDLGLKKTSVSRYCNNLLQQKLLKRENDSQKGRLKATKKWRKSAYYIGKNDVPKRNNGVFQNGTSEFQNGTKVFQNGTSVFQNGTTPYKEITNRENKEEVKEQLDDSANQELVEKFKKREIGFFAQTFFFRNAGQIQNLTDEKQNVLFEWLEILARMGKPASSERSINSWISDFEKYSLEELNILIDYSDKGRYPNFYPEQLNRNGNRNQRSKHGDSSSNDEQKSCTDSEQMGRVLDQLIQEDDSGHGLF